MAELPTGTVTFLFTDIEGSTRLLQQLGERYENVLADHRRLLRAAFEAHSGHEVDTQGDAFFVAFSRAVDALSCAAQAQRSLAAHLWPDGAAVRVRMGLHTGEPMLAGGGYVGLDVHRAARICAAGHGGQILLSQATRDLADGRLPEGTELVDLGEHLLPDLLQLEHIYQLILLDHPADFPPLKTLNRRRHNLPAQATPLIGREQEVAETRGLLQGETRMVTLTGPGGIGKTRLGLQVAAESLDSFVDGVYFVALASLRDAGLVAPAIAQTLGLRESGGRSIEESLWAYLAEKRVLLMLDNFEQLLDAVEMVAGLLAASPGLKLIITSREALRLRGEQEYPVPPLALPEPNEAVDREAVSRCAAVALFVQRARAARPDFALTDANTGAVVEICQRLDGLPLAIELAAAHVKVLSPQAMVPRLASRLSLLTGGPRDLPARQRTLRSAIEWSYDLLAVGEQTLLRRLSVFTGGWTLDAAEEIALAAGAASSVPADMLAGLESLVDKSLVRRREGDDGEVRFRMLETIAEYGMERLVASGEAAEVRRAHAAYYARLAEEAGGRLTGNEQRIWLDRLEREHNNLRTALAWARDNDENAMGLRLVAALWRFWYTHGYLTEGRYWLSFWLERRMPTYHMNERAAQAQALLGAATLASIQSEQRTAIELAEESLALSRELGDGNRVAGALNLLGFMALQGGDVERAGALFEEELEVSRATQDPWTIARALNSLGQTAYVHEDYERAADLFGQGLELMRRIGSKSHIAITLLLLGHVRREQNAFDEATALYREALRLSLELGDKLRVARGLEAMATILWAEGQPERASRLLGAAAELRDGLGADLHPLERPAIDRTMGAVRAVLGDGFDSEWAAGRAFAMEAAVAEALGERIESEVTQ
ncbi:MAG: ATP-binding protein [Ktedonobacterales bacterium]